jgi:tRNA pseudouridine55 synthase
LDGVLVVDKPSGPTSHDVVDRARRALGERRIGHTGTLDPFATGVLALCVGKATRLVRFLAGGEKHYRAEVRLGFATTTDDLQGEPIGRPRAVQVARAEVEDALSRLVGELDQVPPAFSARHVGGRRAYELARRGSSVPLAATRVTVHAIELVELERERLVVDVRCSAGTYVRALARDLGERLGTGAHLAALRRTRSGEFTLEQAVAGDDLGEAPQRVVPIRALLAQMPAARVAPAARILVQRGRELGPESVLEGFPDAVVERVRLLDEGGELIALAVPRGVGGAPGALPQCPTLHPDVVLI